MKPQSIISNLKALGYRIRLNGNEIILKISAPPKDKEKAQRLIDEARKNKAAVIDILKWPPDEQKLIDWFLQAQVPETPFQLRAEVKVLDPVKFWASLRANIDCGVRGARARTGVLQEDLRQLMAKFN